MNAMGIIFANDASIGALTEKRTMASLPFGGRYRQVDFALSNLTCAGVRHVGIITRHSYQSLLNHVGDGEEWGLEMGEGGLEYLTPYAQSVPITTAASWRTCTTPSTSCATVPRTSWLSWLTPLFWPTWT